MKKRNKPFRSIWVKKGNPRIVQIIDQRYLPHQLVTKDLKNLADAVNAIRHMQVRGAPLIGVAAAYGMYLALGSASKKQRTGAWIEEAFRRLRETRPTAVNLVWALEKQLDALRRGSSWDEKIQIAFQNANKIAERDVEICRKIGEHGLKMMEGIFQKKKGKPVNILTHCNAGWLACVEWGTQTSPIYLAFEKGMPLHVWVDETRPRNQGASLTAWELAQKGIPHTVIVDNAGGHLMQHGKVDLVLVGSDRTTRTGDVANKIGTYLKAVAAKENRVPFYVALPSSSIDWKLRDGLKEIPIEERSPEEVRYLSRFSGRKVKKILLTPKQSPASNFGFDVTPARYVTGLITERGICPASEEGLLGLFPEERISSQPLAAS